MLDRWKRAVVHLECATDSDHISDVMARRMKLAEQLQQGSISAQDYAKEMMSNWRSRDIRYHGTALFLTDAGRRYLLTARHVLFDERSAERDYEEEEKRALKFGYGDRTDDLLRYTKEHKQNKIFGIIFRVPSIDEVNAKKKEPEFLMNLGAGTSYSVPYSFSEPALDLALISLDQRDARFANELESAGSAPIPLDDMVNGPDAEGQEVFTVGFPSSTALLGRTATVSDHWASSNYSAPVFSFGRVSMLHESLPFFWADMSAFPGNSGGPVIANDRLVGIVSGQATVPLDDAPDIQTRIPFTNITKARFVRELVEAQRAKDFGHR
jgi:hypothetical protein